jgi:hypothetical protein
MILPIGPDSMPGAGSVCISKITDPAPLRPGVSENTAI